MNPRLRVTLEYALATIIVIVLGGLAGWYFFLRSATSDTQAKDTARLCLKHVRPGHSRTRRACRDKHRRRVGGEAKKPPQLWHVTAAPVGGASFVGRARYGCVSLSARAAISSTSILDRLGDARLQYAHAEDLRSVFADTDRSSSEVSTRAQLKPPSLEC